MAIRVMTAETGVGYHVSRRLCKLEIEENLGLLGFSFANRGEELSAKVFFTSSESQIFGCGCILPLHHYDTIFM